MRMSTRGRYATRIMIRLALLDGEGRPARKQQIASEEGISADYVEQILMKLKTRGLVQSHRGAKGGFSLARDGNTITVADVIEASEGPIVLVPCKADGCNRASACVARRVWDDASAALRRVFSRKTIGQLAREARQAMEKDSTTYEI
jgi:Rrf2 family protein